MQLSSRVRSTGFANHENVDGRLALRRECNPTDSYEAVNAMLLNEFLKEHSHVQEQDAIIARQQKQIDALTAGLQKVSTQLELSNAAARTVSNKN